MTAGISAHAQELSETRGNKTVMKFAVSHSVAHALLSDLLSHDALASLLDSSDRLRRTG
jgi:hypothetical protein